MPVSKSFSKLPLRDLLFVLLVASGTVPLALVDYLLLGMAPRGGRLLETGVIIVVPWLLLVGLSWLFAGWAAAAIAAPARRLSESLAGIARGSYDTWFSSGGAVSELADLSDELNLMSARTREAVDRLRRSERDSANLATDAMRVFRQAVEAKQPLTKHHPGLLEAYSRAVSQHLAVPRTELESSEIALSPFSEPADSEAEERRAQPRFETGDLVVRAPVGARIIDVSPAGLGLESLERLALGRPDSYELVEGSRRLRIPGRAVWCRLVRTVKTASGDQVPVYRAGVVFSHEFSRADRNELLEIVQTHRHVA